ncbi:MAG: hypothetical protein AAB896_01630 [Patescibacteria group bacterium]
MATLEAIPKLDSTPAEPEDSQHEEIWNWWERSWILKEKAKKPLKEKYSLKSSQKSTDLLNFTDQTLTGSEITEITEAVSAVATLTGGAIFNRTNGIALVSKDGMEPGTAGSFNPYDPAVLINMDSVRQPPNDSYGLFAAKIYPGKKITMVQHILAHEYGHSMDLTYLSELEAHGIDQSRVETGWGDKTGEMCVFKDSFSPEANEAGPTRRAREAGEKEDFAESFAIVALGGDISAIPSRYQAIANTIKLAEGGAFIGPHKMTAVKES